MHLFKHKAFHNGQTAMTPEEFKKWLLEYDKNGDGRISRDELRNAIRSCGVWFSGWQSNRAIKIADINHNGVIDDKEIDKQSCQLRSQCLGTEHSHLLLALRLNFKC